MTLAFDEFVAVVKATLSPAELVKVKVHALVTPLNPGMHVFPGATINAQSEAYLAFVDEDPTANWGHAARYLVVNRESGEVSVRSTRLPPFGARAGADWRLVRTP